MTGKLGNAFYRRRLARLLAAGSMLTWPAAVLAQTTPDQARSAPSQTPATEAAAPAQRSAAYSADTAFQGEIIVTAQKRSQTLSDVPISITAQTGEQLVNKGIADVQGLVKVTPGLSYVETGNSVPIYSLRGIGFYDTSLGSRPTVSVYLDEVPLPFSIMAPAASLDLERVEVIKGPQGTLFGQNATGGAINYIAAKPSSTLGGGATVSYGRFNTIDATGYVTGPLSSTLRARVSVRSLTSDDWQYSYTRDDTLGAKRILQGRLLLDWTPSNRLTLTFNVNGYRDRSDTPAAQLSQVLLNTPQNAGAVPLLLPYPVAPGNPRAADWNPGDDLQRHNDFYQFSLRGEYELTEQLKLTSITAYSHMKIDQVTDQDGTALPVNRLAGHGRLRSLSQEVRLSGDVGPAQFVLGANYARDRSNESNLLDIDYTTFRRILPTGPLRSFNLASRQTFDTKAVFGSVDLNLSDTIIAHGGVRYTKADLSFAACSRAADPVSAASLTALFNILRRGAGRAPIPPLAVGQCLTVDETLTPTELVDEFNQDNISWRAGLDWKPAPQTLVYVNVSRGYKSASVPTPPALGVAGYRPVTQETVLAYEGGFKLPIVRRVLEATGAVFYYDYTNKQVLGRILVPPVQIGPLAALVNVPKSRVKGAEFQLNAFPATGLALSLAGTYLKTKVTSNFNDFNGLLQATNFRGSAFPYTPKYQLIADSQYETPFTDRLVGFVGANGSYRSTTNAGFGDVPQFRIRHYGLLDLRAGIRADDRRWQAALFMRNVTNSYYFVNVARLTDTIRRYTGEPRTYGLQLSTKF